MEATVDQLEVSFNELTTVETPSVEKLLYFYEKKRISTFELRPYAKDINNTYTWDLDYAAKHGIIYLPDNVGFDLWNYPQNDETFEKYLDSRSGTKQNNVCLWDPKLPKGFYKVKLIDNGFDLVRLNNPFITTQVGPVENFPDEKDKRWPGSFKRRGFSIDVTSADWCRPYNSYEGEQRITQFPIIRTTKMPTSMFRKNPTFIILFETYHHSWIKEKIEPFDRTTQWSSLYVLKTKEGIVKGYLIQETCSFTSFEPVQDAHLGEHDGEIEFSIIRYHTKPTPIKYKTSTQLEYNKDIIGFCISGSTDTYLPVRELAETNTYYPDLFYGTEVIDEIKNKKKWLREHAKSYSLIIKKYKSVNIERKEKEFYLVLVRHDTHKQDDYVFLRVPIYPKDKSESMLGKVKEAWMLNKVFLYKHYLVYITNGTDEYYWDHDCENTYLTIMHQFDMLLNPNYNLDKHLKNWFCGSNPSINREYIEPRDRIYESCKTIICNGHRIVRNADN